MSSLKKKLNTGDNSLKNTINQLDENDTFKNTLLTTPSKSRSRSVSKMNSIIEDKIKQNEDNISNFKNKQTLNNGSNSILMNIVNSIKKIFVLCFFIVLLLFILVFIFREKIINFSKKIFIPEKKTPIKKNNINDVENEINKTASSSDSDSIKGDDSESKSGFCYIGKINNKRTCANISDQKYCMSGEFFSTKKLCESSGLNKNKNKK